MDTAIRVIIPMRDEHQATNRLVTQLAADAEFDVCVIYDNNSTSLASRHWLDAVVAGAFGERVVVVRRPKATIYQMWNEGWTDALIRCREGQPTHLAILNNDIVVPSGFLGYLSSALNAADEDVWITYPDYDRPLSAGADVTDPPTVRRTSGTWKLGGMSGFAFMLRPERHDTHGWPLIDESFEWLCGDGDLCTQMQQLGGCAARVEGLPVLHDHRRTSRNGRNTWTAAAAKRDLARSRAKYAPT